MNPAEAAHHARQWREWRSALASPRMHHAWILAGRRGLGKHDFALAAAREVVATGRDAPVGENDPDIHLLSHLPKDEKDELMQAFSKDGTIFSGGGADPDLVAFSFCDVGDRSNSPAPADV